MLATLVAAARFSAAVDAALCALLALAAIVALVLFRRAAWCRTAMALLVTAAFSFGAYSVAYHLRADPPASLDGQTAVLSGLLLDTPAALPDGGVSCILRADSIRVDGEDTGVRTKETVTD